MQATNCKLIVDIDTVSANYMLDNVLSVVDAPAMAAAAASFVKDAILSRTKKGKDVNDEDFAPYSPHTRKRGIVNLRDTGAMLDSIWCSASSPVDAIVGCSSPIAGYHQSGTAKMPARRFFGFNEDDYSALITLIYAQPLSENEPVSAPLDYNQNPALPGSAKEPEITWEPVAGDIVKKTLEDGTIMFTNNPKKYSH